MPPKPPTVTQSLEQCFPSANIPQHLTRGDLISLKDLPSQRDLTWTPTDLHKLNQRKAASHLDFFTSKKGIILSSVVCQVAGVEAEVACKRCVRGEGEWKECVIPPVRHGIKTWWACANCFRDGKTHECDLFMKTDQLNKLKLGVLPPVDPRVQQAAEAMYAEQKTQSAQNMAFGHFEANSAVNQRSQAGMTVPYSQASFQVDQTQGVILPTQNTGMNNQFSNGHNSQWNAPANPNIGIHSSFNQPPQANNTSSQFSTPGLNSYNHQDMLAFAQVTAPPGQTLPLPSTQIPDFDPWSFDNIQPFNVFAKPPPPSPSTVPLNPATSNLLKRAAPQTFTNNLPSKRQALAQPSRYGESITCAQPVLAAPNVALPVKPVTYAPGAPIRSHPPVHLNRPPNPSKPVNHAANKTVAPNVNGTLNDSPNGPPNVTPEKVNKLRQDASTPKRGYPGGSQPGLKYVSTPPPVFTPKMTPRSGQKTDIESKHQQRKSVHFSSPIAINGPTPSACQNHAASVASPSPQKHVPAQKPIAQSQATPFVRANKNSLAPSIHQNHGLDLPLAPVVTEAKPAQVTAHPTPSINTQTNSISTASISSAKPIDADEIVVKDVPSFKLQSSTAPKPASELTIDDVMNLPDEMEVDASTKSQGINPSTLIPPVHISMRPGNKPSDATIDQVMAGNEIQWPVWDWEYIEGMREVDRLLEEPVLTAEELEKLLEGWWE